MIKTPFMSLAISVVTSKMHLFTDSCEITKIVAEERCRDNLISAG